MVLELGDTSKVYNDTTELSCDVEFKTKGFFTGSCQSPEHTHHRAATTHCERGVESAC